jgi:hypothetical protein
MVYEKPEYDWAKGLSYEIKGILWEIKQICAHIKNAINILPGWIYKIHFPKCLNSQFLLLMQQSEAFLLYREAALERFYSCTLVWYSLKQILFTYNLTSNLQHFALTICVTCLTEHMGHNSHFDGTGIPQESSLLIILDTFSGLPNGLHTWVPVHHLAAYPLQGRKKISVKLSSLMCKKEECISSKSPVLTHGRTIFFVHFHGKQLMDYKLAILFPLFT